jgi:hypothetical protein
VLPFSFFALMQRKKQRKIKKNAMPPAAFSG